MLWNTIYMQAALDLHRADGHSVRPEDEARLSPLGHEHINLLGRYSSTPASASMPSLRRSAHHGREGPRLGADARAEREGGRLAEPRPQARCALAPANPDREHGHPVDAGVKGSRVGGMPGPGFGAAGRLGRSSAAARGCSGTTPTADVDQTAADGRVMALRIHGG